MLSVLNNNCVVKYTIHYRRGHVKGGMKMNNEIRRQARIHDVRFWQIAKKIGCVPGTLSVWMREELPHEKRELIIAAIKEIVDERGEGEND